jgi:hypothetical protein
MFLGIGGLVFGGCLGPIPGIAALITGLVAQSKIKSSPHEYGGKPYATAGIIIGAISVVFFFLFLLWMFLSIGFG